MTAVSILVVTYGGPESPGVRNGRASGHGAHSPVRLSGFVHGGSLCEPAAHPSRTEHGQQPAARVLQPPSPRCTRNATTVPVAVPTATPHGSGPAPRSPGPHGAANCAARQGVLRQSRPASVQGSVRAVQFRHVRRGRTHIVRTRTLL